MTNLAFQDQMPNNNCWGCGPNNENGLQIKSYWNSINDKEAIMTWTPALYHKAGPDHILNGGIISTLIDCHSVCSAVAYTARDENVPISEDIWFVTGTMTVKYLKPTSIDRPLSLTAYIKEKTQKKSVVICTVTSDGLTTAKGEVIGIRVPLDWLNRSQH